MIYYSILLGTVTIFTLIVTFLGPENHSSRFEDNALAFEEDGGRDDTDFVDSSHHEIREEISVRTDHLDENEKDVGNVRHIERVGAMDRALGRALGGPLGGPLVGPIGPGG